MRLVEELQARTTAMNAKEVAKLFNVTPRLIYQMGQRGELTSMRFGKNSVRFDPQTLIAYLNKKAAR